MNVARSTSVNTGEVSERFKVPDSKSGVRKYRGFESLPLRCMTSRLPTRRIPPLLMSPSWQPASTTQPAKPDVAGANCANPGEVAEWFKAHAWNACFVKANVGSNPTLSALATETVAIQLCRSHDVRL